MGLSTDEDKPSKHYKCKCDPPSYFERWTTFIEKQSTYKDSRPCLERPKLKYHNDIIANFADNLQAVIYNKHKLSDATP